MQMASNSDPTAKPLTETQRIALKDCAGFRIYWRKPKAMEKLAAMGLVERVPGADRAGQLAWRVTSAGREEINRVSK